MLRLPQSTLRLVRAIEADLGTLAEGAPSALEWLPGALAPVLRCEKTAAVACAVGGGGLRVERAGFVGFPPRAQERLDEFLARNPQRFTTFDPLRPEPAQRNVVLDGAQARRLAGFASADDVPVVRELYPRIGLGDADSLRVLVCDGPALLAWVGGFQREPFGAEARRVLQRLVPAMRRRLVAERQIGRHPTMRALFAAAFGSIGGPAFVTDGLGALLEANTLGARWLAQQGRLGREAVREAVFRSGRHGRWSVTRIAAHGARHMHLVLLRPSAEPQAASCVSVAAQRWGLTARQTTVLGLVADGMSTRSIAATLRVAERTIETHLTALYDKAQVEGRAELVATVWKLAARS